MLDIEPVTGTVRVGPRERLAVHRLRGIRPRWCGTAPYPPSTAPRVSVQLRAHGAELPARGVVVGPGRDRVDVELHEPAYGIAPGQAVVVYDGSRVVGSATISETGGRAMSVLATAIGSMPGDETTGAAPTARRSRSCSTSCPTSQPCPSSRAAAPPPP